MRLSHVASSIDEMYLELNRLRLYEVIGLGCCIGCWHSCRPRVLCYKLW